MHGVVGLRLAEALDLHVVLVAPEVRHHDQLRRVESEYRRHHHPGLLGDIAPVLDAHLMAMGVTPGRDVADGPDMRRAGAADLVADDPVVQSDPAAHQPVGGRPRTDTDHHQIGVQHGAVAELHRTHRTRFAAYPSHTDAGAHVHALGAVQPGDEFADLLAEHRRQRSGLRLDQHHVHPEAAQARGNLAADEPGADDDRTPRTPGVLTQRERLVEGAQNVDAVQIGQRWDAPRHQSGGDHQIVVAQHGVARQRQGLCGGVQ